MLCIIAHVCEVHWAIISYNRWSIHSTCHIKLKFHSLNGGMQNDKRDRRNRERERETKKERETRRKEGLIYLPGQIGNSFIMYVYT